MFELRFKEKRRYDQKGGGRISDTEKNMCKDLPIRGKMAEELNEAVTLVLIMFRDQQKSGWASIKQRLFEHEKGFVLRQMRSY